MSTDESAVLSVDTLADLVKLAKSIPSPIRQAGDRDCPYVLVLPESTKPLANKNGIHEGDVIQLKNNPGWWKVVFSRYLPTDDHAYGIRDVL